MSSGAAAMPGNKPMPALLPNATCQRTNNGSAARKCCPRACAAATKHANYTTHQQSDFHTGGEDLNVGSLSVRPHMHGPGGFYTRKTFWSLCLSWLGDILRKEQTIEPKVHKGKKGKEKINRKGRRSRMQRRDRYWQKYQGPAQQGGQLAWLLSLTWADSRHCALCLG